MDDAARERFEAGIAPDWTRLGTPATSLADLPDDATELCFTRIKASHRGVARLRQLRHAIIFAVDQDFLDELAGLARLESLFIGSTTARDLRPLARLARLRRLTVAGGTKIADLRWVEGLPRLEALALENFKRVSRLDPLAALTGLTALGVEGSMWTPMKAASLAPLAALGRLRALFLTNLRVADRDLAPLHGLARLRVLRCAAFFPDAAFAALRAAKPALRCTWFEMLDRPGGIRAGIAAAVKSSASR